MDHLQELACSGMPSERKQAAKHKDAPPRVLHRLANDGQREVRACVAGHENTPLSVLKKLAQDETFVVRKSVAQSPKVGALPEETQLSLLRDRVKYTLAQNKAVSPSVLARCLGSKDAKLRKLAVSNPSAPKRDIELLRRAGADKSLEGVVSPPDALSDQEEERLRQIGPYGRLLLASHPDTGAALLERLSHSSWEPIKKAVAGNANCSGDLLLRFAQYRRADLISNSAQYYPDAVANNPALEWIGIEDPARLKEILSWEGRNLLASAGVPESWLYRAADHPRVFLRKAVAQNPDAPASILERLVGDPDKEVRQKVASHPNATPDMLKELIEDVERSVRIAAATNFEAASSEWACEVARNGDADLQHRMAEEEGLPDSVARALVESAAGYNREDVLYTLFWNQFISEHIRCEAAKHLITRL